MKTESRLPACSERPLWEERVDAVPRSWFEALTENPRRLPMRALPFDEDARRHLAGCPTCIEAALEALEQRARLRWRVLCPEAGDISAWLRGEANPQLETHLRGCVLCAEQTKRAAWLAHGARLLSCEQVETKLRVIQPAPELAPDLWEAFVRWLVQYFWPTEDERRAVAGWRLLVGGRRAARATQEELKERLAGDESVTLFREGDHARWLLAQRQGASVVMQAGASAAEKRLCFSLVFRRGNRVVHRLTTRDGRLCVTEEDFAQALAARADGFEVEITGG